MLYDKILFIDMDGCIADFDSYVYENWEKEYHLFTFEEKVDFWNNFQPDDFRKLKPSIYINDLISSAKRKFDQIYILTALPSMRKEMAVEYMLAKRDWAAIHIPGIQVLFGPLAKDKQFFCKGPNHVLIDDNRQNIVQWKNAGGIGITNICAEDLNISVDYINKLVFTDAS